MSPSRKRSAGGDQEMREQEVLRANKELAAYFRGRRTEREARAALKIIKAFIRDRERLDPASRRPLPGADRAERPNRPEPPKSARRASKTTTASAQKKRKPRELRRPPDSATAGRDTQAARSEDGSAHASPNERGTTS